MHPETGKEHVSASPKGQEGRKERSPSALPFLLLLLLLSLSQPGEDEMHVPVSKSLHHWRKSTQNGRSPLHAGTVGVGKGRDVWRMVGGSPPGIPHFQSSVEEGRGREEGNGRVGNGSSQAMSLCFLCHVVLLKSGIARHGKCCGGVTWGPNVCRHKGTQACELNRHQHHLASP